MANGHGGPRKGAGRRPAHDEMRARDLARQAIINVYGSEEKGFEALLRTGEPTLVKWVYEHAQGKPTEHIDMTTRVEETRIVDVDDDGNEEDDDELSDEKDDDE
jgi:hypothetical protein